MSQRGRGRGRAGGNGRITNDKKVLGGTNNIHLFLDKRFSTQDNKDPSYTEIGIIHTCESAAINMLRETVTGILNAFGRTGFDNSIFDLARNKCLDSMKNKLDSDTSGNVYKIANIRFEAITVDPSLITMNAYGTLLQKNDIKKDEIK
jgi:hypothetical protein